MGNCLSIFLSVFQSSESMNPDDDGSTPSSPLEPSQPCPPMDAIESIRDMYLKIDPVKQTALLMGFVEHQLQRMNNPSQAESSSSEGWLKTIQNSTKFAAKTIDTISTEADRLSNPDAIEEIASVTFKTVQGVGDLDWAVVGLSVAAYAVEKYMGGTGGHSEKECRELLLNILQGAQDVKHYSQQMPSEKETLCDAVRAVVGSTVIFCNYLAKNYRCWSAAARAAQLEKTTQQLKDVRDFLRKQTIIPRKYYGQGKDVFLSHSGNQKNFVRQLHRDLTGEGVSCFFDEDENSLPKGEEFPRLIFEAAEKCKIAVLVLSEGFICSKWPMLELSAFVRAKSQKNADLTILPVFFEIDPRELKDIQKYDSVWKQLGEKDDTRSEWQHALKVVCKTNGLPFREGGNEVDLRDKIRERVRCLLRKQAALQLPQLDFKPEGIEEQTEKVKQLLDIGGSEAAIAGVIVGLAGIGKSTLAVSVIRSLKLSSTGFKFSMVTIDERIRDMIPHIIKLQTRIISDFTGLDLNLQGVAEGREQIRKAMAGKSCFLYIDNVVDRTYVKELLPRVLLQSPSAENPQNEMHNTKTKIRIVITARQNNLKPLLDIKNFVHHVQNLSDHTADKILKRTILGDDKPAHDFDEGLKIHELAKACKSVPLLLSVFGNHFKDKDKRDKGSYDEAIKALNKGDIDPSGDGDEEEQLSERLMYVYDKMKDEEAREVFLDICTYFHGFEWNLVADIENNATLEILQKKMLVNKSEVGTVIVHDLLRLMGEKKAKGTRLMNQEEFFNINYNESKLENIKGMVLNSPAGLITLETRHLNAMRQSLRFLALGDWVRVEGHPCDRGFENLRYLEVGDLNAFPFQDVCRMKKINVFFNRSKPGMELAQLPPNLKYLSHEIPNQDCNEIARLPLQNLKSLKTFMVKTKRSVRLPQRLKLPSSLEHLELNICEQLLTQTFSRLSALQTLALNKCDLKGLPQEFTQSVALRSLSMQRCKNLISLPDNIFGSLCSLRDLNLKGCTGLQNLPADLGTLTALQNLNIEYCESLRVLPENFGRLESLKALNLHGCISLQRLPDSFGMLRIEHLTLYRLHRLEELPESMDDLSCLKRLTINYCPSLEFVPDSVGQLTNLEELEVSDCEKVGALTKSFEQLSSLKAIRLYWCLSLRRLPDGLQSLKTLKSMMLINCSSVVHLPACFEMLSSLEELRLLGMSISSLPDGLGKLKKLKSLIILNCLKFQTFPQGLENLATLETVALSSCPVLEGTTMDKIVKLHNCHYANIGGSTKLIERWREMEEQNQNLPMIVQTSWDSEEYQKEEDRARRVGLLCGNCIQLGSTGQELIHHPSLSIPNNTTVAVISLHRDQRHLFQQTVEMAQERARTNCGGQLRIIYVCRTTDGSDAPTREDETEEIRQLLTMLHKGISYAIPSTDIRRLSLIGRTTFVNSDVFSSGPKLLCFVVDVREDDEGRQIWKDGKRVTEDEISNNLGEEALKSENSDEEIESFDGIVEFINCICESERHSCSLSGENTVGYLIQNLNNKIHHFSDNKVKVDLQGKTVAIIFIDLYDYDHEFKRLQQIYLDIKLKQSNFEAVWITPLEAEYKGYGSYSRAMQCMPWLTLADPKSIKVKDIKDKSPRVIIINSEGSVGSSNALSALMSWGEDAYPFTKGCLSQLDSKSSLEILFHSAGIKEGNNKVIFVYAEPPCQELKMKSTLEKLVRIHGEGNFEIVYVGRLLAWNRLEKDATDLKKAYEDAAESMNWTKLSLEDMMHFWCRCQRLSGVEVHEPKWASTLSRLLKALWNENRWLVVIDGEGMVTAHGLDVAEMACEVSDDEVDTVMKGELRESLKEGKCRESVRRYFRDEINYPQHRHPLLVPSLEMKEQRFACDMCQVRRVYTSYGKWRYRCDDCDWDLCWRCWKEFVKEERENAEKR